VLNLFAQIILKLRLGFVKRFSAFCQLETIIAMSILTHLPREESFVAFFAAFLIPRPAFLPALAMNEPAFPAELAVLAHATEPALCAAEEHNFSVASECLQVT